MKHWQIPKKADILMSVNITRSLSTRLAAILENLYFRIRPQTLGDVSVFVVSSPC